MRDFRGVWALYVAGICAAAAPARAAQSGGAEIVGGHSISITEAPWQMMFRPSGSMCGAVWLGGRWVATAAHCVEGAQASSSYVYAGITRDRDATNANRIAVKRIVLNPKNNGIDQDISLLELAADVAAPLAKPIRYATAADATAGLTNVGVACMATGWGGIDRNVKFPDSLQRVDSKIHSLETYVINWAGQGGTANVGSCQGDSGGPMVVKDASGNGWILAGISSFITSFCGDPKSPSGYARVSAIAYFISQYAPQAQVGVESPRMDLTTLFFPRPDRFRLAQGGNLDITWTTLGGTVLGGNHGYFAAGEHSLPVTGLASGRYVVQINGKDFQLRHMLTAAP